MHKTILLLTLVGVTTQPMLGMSRQTNRHVNCQNPRGYYAPQQTPYLNSVDPDTLLLGGAVAVGVGLVYWLYRSNYKSSLKQARESLADAQKKVTELHATYINVSLENIQSNKAVPLQQQFIRDKNILQEVVNETNAHINSWEGYRDYRHDDAMRVVDTANTLITTLGHYQKDLNHRIALFVINDTTTISSLETKYNVMYNPMADVATLAIARERLAEVESDLQTLSVYGRALNAYVADWSSYSGNRADEAQALAIRVNRVKDIMTDRKVLLTHSVNVFELKECSDRIKGKFIKNINAITQPTVLGQSINAELYNKQFPLLAYVETIEHAECQLQSAMNKVTRADYEVKAATDVLAELSEIKRVVVNLPVYATEKEQFHKAKAASEALAEQARQAREERETQERIARQEREAADRRAREDRQAKERQHQEQLEEQRRVRRAKEQEAIAARDKAEAELRRARAEEERVRIERERLAREFLLHSGAQPAQTNINITVKKKDLDLP